MNLIKNAVMMERKRELDHYRKYVADPDFEKAFDARPVLLGYWQWELTGLVAWV